MKITNKKADITVNYLIQWFGFAFIYFTVVIIILVQARESVLPILNTTESIIAGILIIAPMAGLIYDLFRKKADRDYFEEDRF
jgi:uncharacterized protein YqhQ